MNKHAIFLLGAGGLLTAGLSACVVDGDSDLGQLFAQRVEYQCDDDPDFVVTFTNDRDDALVTFEDARYELDLEDRDGDRYRYEGDDDDAVLIVEDDKARFESDERESDDCEVRS